MRFFVVMLSLYLVCFATVGCKKVKKKMLKQPFSEEQKQNEKVESVNLAKAILLPKPYKFKVQKDPFKPLLGKTYVSEDDEDTETSLSLQLIGVVTLGDYSAALLRSPAKSGVFQVGETIDSYRIEKITSSEVVLTKGKEKVVLKMGGE